MGNIDHDAVLRARVLLLGSGRLGPWEEIGAYRVLAEVSPRAYLPKLVDALLAQAGHTRDPERALALFEEAADGARRLGAGLPDGNGPLLCALDARRRALFAAGRRSEGRAVCEELAEAGSDVRLAVVLAEEGRHAEAAALYGRHAEQAGKDGAEGTLVEWAAELDAAGRREQALRVFGRLVDAERRRAARDGDRPAALVGFLVHQAGMLRAAGARAAAAAAVQEALGVLGRLARDGEPATWDGRWAHWIRLFPLSVRSDEPAATPEAPQPPFGSCPLLDWSPDTRGAWLAGAAALEERAAALRASGELLELLTVQRRLTARRAVRRNSGDVESLLPEFDSGVALARRLPGAPSAVARALTDRAMFLLAARRYAQAHRDLAEAGALSDGPV
ncbi:hypothetical protein ACH414_20225 [Streptomyces sp. NPDC020422]|uniref:hypothetical protein n=1 Tax=Streptomyces sp. NPDC020422 TaxID=3365074 RepID=UPI00379D0207